MQNTHLFQIEITKYVLNKIVDVPKYSEHFFEDGWHKSFIIENWSFTVVFDASSGIRTWRLFIRESWANDVRKLEKLPDCIVWKRSKMMMKKIWILPASSFNFLLTNYYRFLGVKVEATYCPELLFRFESFIVIELRDSSTWVSLNSNIGEISTIYAEKWPCLSLDYSQPYWKQILFTIIKMHIAFLLPHTKWKFLVALDTAFDVAALSVPSLTSRAAASQTAEPGI